MLNVRGGKLKFMTVLYALTRAFLKAPKMLMRHSVSKHSIKREKNMM
jgi:hypothetical protein